MTVDALDAWLYGTLVASIATGRDRRPELAFTGDALDRWGLNSSVVSGLLPLSTRAPSSARVGAWLRGLLPEGRARTELANRAGVDPDDVVAFLGVYGQDTAGALVLVPQGTDPAAGGDARAATGERIGELLDQARVSGAADQLNSLGGLETKIVLVRTPDGWAEPSGRTPSTHIVKLSRPADSRAADLIDTEAAALALARVCGLSTVQASIATFAGRRAIVVERYDRRVLPDGTVDRIHQEDGAQLLGLDTRDPDSKFQWGRRLPSLKALAERLVAMGDVRPTGLLALTTFNLAIGNTDAHAKNISLVHHDDGSVALAPAYDVAMHRHLAQASTRFAMDVHGARDTETLSADDLVAEGRTWGLTARDATGTVHATLTALTAALETIDHGEHPGVGEPAWEMVRSRTRRLLDGASAPAPRPTRATGRSAQARAPRGTPTGGRFTAEPS